MIKDIVKVKVLRIIDLSMILNNYEVKPRTYPVVSIRLYSTILECDIYSGHWGYKEMAYDFRFFHKIDLRNDCEKELDECINKLEELCREWGAIK